MEETQSSRVIMHVDMDAFFASIEQRNNPELRGKPVIVGGHPGSRGVVSTCSYEAREYGVHSAMPIAQAVQKCKDGVFLSVDPSAYGYAAHQIKEIFQRFSPAVQMVSVDEAFIDITGSQRTHGTPVDIALKIKSAVKQEIGITCSVGIGPNKLIAKLASGLEKPDGLTVLLSKEEIARRVFPLPVGRLWGVGPVTEKYLISKGIVTIADLACAEPENSKKKLGVRGQYLAERARGVDDNLVLDEEEQPDEKSISHECTLDQDTVDPRLVHSLLLKLAEKVVCRMQDGGWLARTVALRLRFANFETITRQISFDKPMDDFKMIFESVCDLLPVQDIVCKRVRLVGVRASNLVKEGTTNQGNLFETEGAPKRERLDQSIKSLRNRFGNNIITRVGTMREEGDC